MNKLKFIIIFFFVTSVGFLAFAIYLNKTKDAEPLTFNKQDVSGLIEEDRKVLSGSNGEDEIIKLDDMLKLGKQVYYRHQSCVSCHNQNGEGFGILMPPLAGSDWLDDDERIIKIVLHGLVGNIKVMGKPYGKTPMAAFKQSLNDLEIAAVLTYIKQSWGNKGKMVKVSQVRKVRQETQSRNKPYLGENLLKEHPLK